MMNGKIKKNKDIIKEVEVIRKVHSALDLEGEHLEKEMDVDCSLFELARYLYDENEVYIVTNYPDEIKAKHNNWLKKLKNDFNEPFIIISPSQAIYLMKNK